MHSTKNNNIKLPIPLKNIRRSNDPIGDMITRIRNGYVRMFDSVIVPKSNKIRSVLDVLIRSGYISHYEDFEASTKQNPSKNLMQVILNRSQDTGYLNVFLKYHNSSPALQNIQRISSPGKRVYFSKNKIKKYAKLQNWGLTKTLILSTSKGVFTHQEVLKLDNSMGGESLCFIW
jgi:small subunit ribosomal protein S8